MLGQGRQAAIIYLKENKKEAASLEKEIRDLWEKRKSGKDLEIGKEEEPDGDIAVIEEQLS